MGDGSSQGSAVKWQQTRVTSIVPKMAFVWVFILFLSNSVIMLHAAFALLLRRAAYHLHMRHLGRWLCGFRSCWACKRSMRKWQEGSQVKPLAGRTRLETSCIETVLGSWSAHPPLIRAMMMKLKRPAPTGSHSAGATHGPGPAPTPQDLQLSTSGARARREAEELAGPCFSLGETDTDGPRASWTRGF